MAIVRMKKVRVMAMADTKQQLLSQLLKLGCVEITEPDQKLEDPQWASLMKRDSSELMAKKNQINDVNTSLNAIKKFAQMKDGLFIKRYPISEQKLYDAETSHKAQQTSEMINGYLQQLTSLISAKNRLETQKSGLLPWRSLNWTLSPNETENVLFKTAVCPAGVDLNEVKRQLTASELLAEVMEVSTDREQHYLLLICHKEAENEVMDLLRQSGFSVVSLQNRTGSPAQSIAEIDAELAQNAEDQERITQEIVNCKDARDILRIYADRLTAEADKEVDVERFLTNGTIVFFEGWAPAKQLSALEKLFQDTGCAWEALDPKDDEEPPILLENPRWMRSINMVTEMYSMPAYRGIDPNPLIFGFFIFFFGFMFADVAYGLIILLVCSLVLKKYDPKGGTRNLFELGRYLGITTTVCGVFTGGFFGDAIPVFAETFLGIAEDQFPSWLQTFTNGIAFSPVNDPMTALGVALVIGVIQLLFGQCVHIYMRARDHHPMDGLLDVVPWWVVFAGIGMAAVGRGSTLLIIGILSLICTQGRTKRGFFGKLFGGMASLYDITSWLSDVLSYSRLMALMLATSVIASVMNTIGALPKSIIAFVIIFLIGHTFNIGVNLIGTFVHAIRLQYLEFYGKFYEEGGTSFHPLRYNTKYVDIIKEEK